MDNPSQPPSDTPDAPDKEKMDQIRRRRLEKLQGPTAGNRELSDDSKGTVSSSSTAGQPNVASNDLDTSNNNITNVSTASNPQNPFEKLGLQQPQEAPTASRKISPGDGGVKRSRDGSDSFNTSQPPRKTTANAKDEAIEEYENRIIGSVFRITLDESHLTDSSGHRLTALPELRKELEEAGEPIRLTVGTLDSAILEAASRVPHNKPVLDYLLPCWKRILRAFKGLKGHMNGKDTILKEAKRLCMSNCIFAVTMPELFGREPNPTTDSLVPYLLASAEDEKSLCHDFLTEAVSRFDEDDSIKSMFTKAAAGLSFQLSRLTMNDDYKRYVYALKTLTRFPPITAAIAEDPLFQLATSAPDIEKRTILGPFFQISPLQPDVTRVYFAGPKTMDKGHILTSQNALRLTLNGHQKDLLDIINAFVRASDKSRSRTLDWFAYIVNENHKRRAMRVDERQVSSDGFMMNLTVVLDGLCEPFMDTTFSKVSKIDVDYLRRNPRINIKDETKLNADQNASDKFYEAHLPGTSNFISEVFFLTLAAHHYGSEATNAKLKNLDRDIKHFQNEMTKMEIERPKLLGNAPQLALFDANLKRYNEVLEKSMALKFAIEGVLFDDIMQARSLQFMRYVIVFMLRLATGTEYIPGNVISLPLPMEQPAAFQNLPEYVLDDIVSNFKFIVRFIPQIIISSQTDELIALCITFLRNSEYIKNPYLKSGLVTLLFHGTWPVYHRQKGILGDSLTGDKFANDHLLHSLMKFYIEAESTGTHTQFFDKFNIRFEIFQVIKCIWSNDIYKQRLTQESRVNTDFFVRFVNLLLNDATFVLDESLTKFPKIHDLQIELRNPKLAPEERATKEEELAAAEGQAQSYMQLANETIAMMKLFTSALSESFTMPEIVQRLADMLDYNLDTLVGPKSNNLRVEDRTKYHFEPRTLLAEFIDIYLNLGGSERFIEAVARDGRSYKPANFDNAAIVISSRHLKSIEEQQAWKRLCAKFQTAKELDDQAEEDLGEIPDEFLDPLMYTLMEDPIILPMSKQTMDRSTIRSHLLSDPTDPFNRQPMSIDDVVPDLEMRERIRVFKEERKAIAKKAYADRMDTTE